MSLAGILDAVVVLILLGYLSLGWILGFLRSAFGLIGLAAGAIGSFFFAPLVGSMTNSPGWRIFLVIFAVVALLALGQILGLVIGRSIAKSFEDVGPHILDRLAGILLNVLVAALVISSAAFSANSLGVPWLSQAISNSVVLRGIDQLTPNPVKQSMAQLRSIVVQQGIPQVVSAAEGPTKPPKAPAPLPNPDSHSLESAASSVVRVSGSAYQCGQNQSGSGFVVSKERVITNAHVVAGVSEPVVEMPGVTALPGKVVYFDPEHDLAVIAVPGLKLSPLDLGSPLGPGSLAIFDGYPYGGPFQSSPARVDKILIANVNNIYGKNAQSLEVYQLAADVREGNSGGPLLDQSGDVVGVVFARSANTSGVGYALTLSELEPVAQAATSLDAKVSTGACIQH